MYNLVFVHAWQTRFQAVPKQFRLIHPAVLTAVERVQSQDLEFT